MRLVYYLIAITWGLTFWQMPTHDPDLGWHLLGGAWTLTHGDVPRVDPINSFGSSWIDYHWLGQILLFKIYKLGGFEALRIWLGIFMGIFGVILARIVEKNIGKSSAIFSVLTFILLATCVGEIVSVRPHVIGLILLGLTVLILSEKSSWWELGALFVLAVIGANTHVYWLFVPILWGFYRCIPRLFSKNEVSAAYAWSGLLLLSVAGFISPYGVFTKDPAPQSWLANYAVLFDYTVMPAQLRDFINELKPGFAAAGIIPALLICAFAIWVKQSSFKGALDKIGETLSAILSFVLTMRAIKFVGLFGILSAPSFAGAVGAFVNENLKVQKIARIQPILLSIIGVLIFYKGFSTFPAWDDKSFYMEENLPIEACKKIPALGIASAEGRDHVRVLTHFNHGGWCRWAAYEKNPEFLIKVTTDGRTQMVPVEEYEKSFDLYRLKNQWAQTLQTWNPDVVLADKNTALAQIMVRAPQEWKVAHEDETFALFLPVKGLSQSR